MKVSTLDKICWFLAELIGTGLLVFLGCMGCIQSSLFANNHLQSALNFGLVVMIIIQSFGCVSGAHLNPAVTVAAYIYDLVSLSVAALYCAGQLLGGFIGYGLLKVLVPSDVVFPEGATNGLCVTALNSQVSAVQGCVIEFILTAVLILVCCAIWDPRNAKSHDSVAIRFGLTIASLAITGGQLTGASMNPARSFAPAIWNNNFQDHWIYWFGPLLAAIITAVVYKTVFRREVVEVKPADNKLRNMEEVPLS